MRINSENKSLWLGFGLLGIFLLLLLYASAGLISVFEGASDSVKAASISALVGVFTFVIGRYLEQKRELKQKVNQEKIRVYEKFFDIFFGMFNKKEDESEHEVEKKLLLEIREFQKELLLWGSDAVIKAWLDFMSAAPKFDFSDEQRKHASLAEALRVSGAIMIAMRKDVGYPFSSIRELEFAKLILRQGDPENLIVLRNMEQRGIVS